MNDMVVAAPMIGGSIGFALLFGFIYMLFLYIFAGIIVWICIILYVVALVCLTLFSYMKYDDIKTGLEKNNGVESGQYTTNNRDMYLTMFIILAILTLVSLIIICCNFRNIQIAIAVIKTAAIAIKDMPLMLLVPPIFTIVIGIWWLWWLYSFVFLYSVGEVSKSPNGPYAAVTHD